jgi:hypothetical protein
MKTFQIESWVTFRRVTPGRRGHVARHIRRLARLYGLDDIVALCDAIIQAEDALLLQQQQFKAGQALATEATWSPEVLALDVVLDRHLAELRNFLAALAVRVGTPRGDAAKVLLDAYFVQGLPYYTQQPIEEESARVGVLVVELAGKQAQVTLATADDMVADVAATHAQLAALVEKTVKAQRIAFDAIKAADLANHRALLGLFVEILAHTGRLPEAEGLALRAELLAEAAAQDAEVAAAIRARRPVVDVNPETGAPVAEA